MVKKFFHMNCQSEDRNHIIVLGNGCLMRISSIPMIFDLLDDVKLFCDFATEMPHNHPLASKPTPSLVEILWYLPASDKSKIKKPHIRTLCEKYNLSILSVNEYKNLGGFEGLS